jgi:hypothetical protein
MARRKASEAIDWDPIKREYCLAQVTVRTLAMTHGVDPAALVRKAKKEGWVRSKRAEVRAMSEHQLLMAGIVNVNEKAIPTALDVAAAATVRTNVILAHRRDAGRARTLAMTMMQELEVMNAAPMVLRDMQELLRKSQAGEELPAELLNRADQWLGQALTLDNRTGILKALSETLTRLVAIEREAFGIGEPEPPPPPGDGVVGAYTDFAAFRAKFMAAVARHNPGVIEQ